MTRKKSKIECHDFEDERHPWKRKKEENDSDAVLEQAWTHFRSFVDSENGMNGDLGHADIDELYELIELLEAKAIGPFELDDFLVLNSKHQLLPVLISVASYILADKAIEEYLLKFEKQFASNQKGYGDDIPVDDVKRHLNLSIRMFPKNAASWAMAANFARMTLRLPSFEQKIAWYAKSADCASLLRTQAIKLLNDEFGPTDIELKEWIELLILNHVCGVELMIMPKNEQGKGTSEDSNDRAMHDDNDSTTEGSFEEGTEVWSPSAIEGTSRYMLAMLNSISGKHDDALEQIKCFTQISHRLHPNVWRLSSNFQGESQTSSNHPRIYRKSNGGILPEPLYIQLCQVFEPNSHYWTESDYSRRGYYSFFMDVPEDFRSVNNNSVKAFNASNVIEDVVCNHLLPLARKHLNDAGRSEYCTEICGYEWWVHTRTVQANLGHNLHFDTDETLLEQEKKITHPILSCVLYLTGGNVGGATIILDQTPDSAENALQGWISVPRDNQCLIFPGNLLHGVLPCPDDLSKQMDMKHRSDKELFRVDDLWESNDSRRQNITNRLTFMVGFWTRRVPDNMPEQKLYGPCGPLPEAEPGATWIEGIKVGYPSKEGRMLANLEDVVPEHLKLVNNPWECVRSNTTSDVLHLEIPSGLDHRFFVANPPQCFRDSLFESKTRHEFDAAGDEVDESIASDESP